MLCQLFFTGNKYCLFLDVDGHVCELSAANIFIVKNKSLITPGTSNDILEGINRRTVIEAAHDLDITVIERRIDLTELYIADEVFACGTSAFIAPIVEIQVIENTIPIKISSKKPINGSHLL